MISDPLLAANFYGTDDLDEVVEPLSSVPASTASPTCVCRYREKLRLIRLLYQSGYTKKEVVEVFRFIDWVMHLPRNLETKLSKHLEVLEEETKMKYVTTWERRGIEKGLEKDLLKGKAAVLGRLLARRFGDLPEWAETRLNEANSKELDRWTDLVLDADRLADVFQSA